MSEEAVSAVLDTHAVLTQICEFVHQKWGASVGPVWVCATSATPSDEDMENGIRRPVEMLQIRFQLNGRELVLQVSAKKLAESVHEIGDAHRRLMGR